ncbi:hypothetical protein DSUL_30102 [Desulfovibrionales bacterium]
MLVLLSTFFKCVQANIFLQTVLHPYFFYVANPYFNYRLQPHHNLSNFYNLATDISINVKNHITASLTFHKTSYSLVLYA